MQKQAPTLGRLLVMAGFALSCFGLLLFLWLAFGGPIPLQPKGYRFKVSFPEATQLAQEADVRISGVPVGKVKTLTPRAGRTLAEVELDERYAPVPSDARAILRQKTLLGETYVELTPGHENAKPLAENQTLKLSSVADTVELDEILRAFDPKTRAQFQTWMVAQAQSLSGRGQDISDSIGNLAPFEEETTNLLRVLNRQEGAVSGLISNTGEVLGALTERGDQLQGLITNGNRVFETTAQRNRDLQAVFQALPTFERESQQTLQDLTRFARNTDPVVDELRPAARELTPTLIDLQGLAPELAGLFRELGPLITAADRGLPAVRRVLNDLVPVLGQVDPVLRQVNPALYGLSNYTKEFAAFFANSAASTQATDKPPKSSGVVHYLRTSNPVNPEVLAAYPRRIGTNRPNPYQLPGAFSQLSTGLPVYESRHCGRGVPTLGPQLQAVLEGSTETLTTTLNGRQVFVGGFTKPVVQEIQDYVFGRLNNPDTPPSQLAPPCNQQIPYPPVGGTGQQGATIYPQVYADPPGQTPINQPPSESAEEGAAALKSSTRAPAGRRGG